MEQRQTDVVTGAAEVSKGVGEEVLRAAGERAHAEFPQPAGRLFDGDLCEAGIGQQLLAAHYKYFAGLGRPHAAGTAHEQLAGKFTFKQSSVQRNSRCGVAQRLCCSGERPKPCRFNKGA